MRFICTDILVASRYVLILFLCELSMSNSVVDSAKLALAEGTAHELVGNDVDIVVLLHEHVVDLEVGEAEFVEVLQSLLHAVLIAKGLNRFEVELLGALLVDVNGALHERAWLAEWVNGSLNLWLFDDGLKFAHLLVASCSSLLSGNWLLRNHLDRVLNSNRLDQVTLKVLMLYNLVWLDAEDIAADLMSELNLSSLQSEERGVASLLDWGLELNGDFEGGSSGDLILQSHDLGLHVVA